VVAEDFQHIGQKADATSEQDQADEIERVRLCFPIVRKMPVDHVQTEEADGHVEEKNDAPIQVANDQASRNGTEHGANQSGNGHKAHRAD
jgi:hypothetical protein